MNAVDPASRERDAEPARGRSVSVAIAVVSATILIGAAVVRALASAGDLWLDEIWSLTLASKVTSPLDVLTRVHHDNNHPLNTLCLYLLGERDTWMVYRIPALVAGSAAVAVAGLIGKRRSAADALTAMLLTGSSYLLIHYSSEARGYGAVVFFALLALYLMEHYLDGRRWVAWLFGPVAILGFLSHLTFIHAYAGVGAWSLVRFVRGRRSWVGVLLDVVRCHLVPIAFLILFYFLQIRRLAIGGGPERELFDTILRAAALTLGAPDTGMFAVAAGVVAALLVGLGSVASWRDRSGLWLCYVIAIVLSPAVLIVVRPPEFIAIRYFLVSAAVFVLLLSRLLAGLCRRGRGGQIAYLVLIALFVFGNGVYTTDLIRLGRGDYSAAIRYMIGQTPGGVITVGSDHDFRNALLLSFYARQVVGGRRLTYVDNAAYRPDSPTWLIAHRYDPGQVAPGALRTQAGQVYALEQSYGYARLSGCQWFLYRKTRP
jgi:hypothetical protein